MAAVAEELATAQRRGPVPPVTRWVASHLLGPDTHLEYLTEALLVELVFHGRDHGVEAHAIGDHQDAVESGRDGDEIQAFGFAVGHGLFQQHVLSSFQAVLGDGVVQVVRQN